GGSILRRDFSVGGPPLPSRGGKVELGSNWYLRDQSIAVGRTRRPGIACPGIADMALRRDPKKSGGVAHSNRQESRARSDSPRKPFSRQRTADHRIHGTMAVRFDRRRIADV